MRYQGRLRDWNDDKGFGFVAPNGGGDNVFVHIKAFKRLSRRPVDGDLITYTVAKDARARLRAESVRLAIEPERDDARATPGMIGPAFALLFVAALTGAGFTDQLPMAVLAGYGAMSVIAIIVYGIDKSAATAGRQRTPESTLHLLGLLCGWPGALLAQRVLRHKSRKREFQSAFWGIVIINVAALMLFGSDTGRAWLGI